MTKIQCAGTKGAMLVAVASFILSTMAARARADLTVCNKTDDLILYAQTTQTTSCSSGWAQHGWWLLSAHSCSKIFVGNVHAAMPIIWNVALDFIGAGSGFHWPQGSSNVWAEELSDPTSFFQDNGCFEGMQQYCSAGNVGVLCDSLPHSSNVINTYNATFSYSF
jgi:hypothetical protein